jgi:hypothetical protein
MARSSARARTVSREVTITPSARAYAPGERIVATVANHLDHPVYAFDHNSDCTIATLERWDGQSWRPIWGCALGRIELVVAIPKHSQRTLTINPFSYHFGAPFGVHAPAFGAGRYRLRIDYRFDPDRAAPDLYHAYSPPFRIRD